MGGESTEFLMHDSLLQSDAQSGFIGLVTRGVMGGGSMGGVGVIIGASSPTCHTEATGRVDGAGSAHL